jgi:hypothetical protein
MNEQSPVAAAWEKAEDRYCPNRSQVGVRSQHRSTDSDHVAIQYRCFREYCTVKSASVYSIQLLYFTTRPARAAAAIIETGNRAN